MIGFLRKKESERIEIPPEFQTMLNRTDFSEFESFRMAYLAGMAAGLKVMGQMVRAELRK